MNFMNEKKNEPLQPNNEPEKEQVIEKPLDVTPENVKKVKEAIAEEVRQEAGISDDQAELFKQMCLEADMPVEFLDKDFKLGNQELDIRKLSQRNFKQMIFRTLVLQNVYLKNLTTSLIDITRLLLIKLDHDGVEDIVGATDDIIEKIAEQNKVHDLKKKQQALVKPEEEKKSN